MEKPLMVRDNYEKCNDANTKITYGNREKIARELYKEKKETS